ncbi:MAG: hypothetical protein EON94_10960, partial [Caulobacteraceae bacterium]
MRSSARRWSGLQRAARRQRARVARPQTTPPPRRSVTGRVATAGAPSPAKLASTMSLKFILMTAGCASLLAPVSALAQDYDWTGFYVGANAGASWGDTSLHSRVEQGGGIVIIPPAERDLINADLASDDNETGFTGGLQAGYNFQSGSWVFGLETDVGWMD